MDGPEISEGDIELKVFLSELELLRKAIAVVDLDIYSGNGSTRLRIAKLSKQSPTSVTIEAEPSQQKHDMTQIVFGSLVKSFDSVSQGSIPEDTNYELLDILLKLARPVGDKISDAVVTIGAKSFELTRSFARTIEEALERSESCVGSIEGALEAINLHGHTNRFTIYPNVGPDKVVCEFPETLHNAAVSGVDRTVVVSGILHYRPRGPFPYRVTVQDIVINPDDTDLPSFEDVRGLAAGIDPDIPSEDKIRKVRDAWS